MVQRRWEWFSEILVAQGYDVDVLAPPPRHGSSDVFDTFRVFKRPTSRVEIGICGEKIFRTPGFQPRSKLTARAMNQILVAVGQISTALRLRYSDLYARPDVVIGTVPALPTAFSSLLIARIFGSPLIIDLRDAWPDLFSEHYEWERALGQIKPENRRNSGLKELAIRGISRSFEHAVGKAERLIVTSAFLADSINSKMVKSELSQERAVVVRNVFPPKLKFHKVSTSKSPSTLKVLYAGTIGRAQNLANVVRAVDIARHCGVDIDLKLVGSGAGKPFVSELAQSLGVNLQLNSRVSPSNMEELYTWADVCLVHLTDWDPLQRTVPSKTYELMSVGMFIIAVASGETRRLVEELGAGQCVNPESPWELAEALVSLARLEEVPVPDSSAARWVEDQRTRVAPRNLVETVRTVARRES